jgi:TfoX/Sxy family transcriptional regulator of competence genes
MAFDESLAQRTRNAFRRRRVAFEEKRMMGGLCFLVDGKMCVGVERTRLMVRIDPEIYEAALERKGCAPMDFTGRPLRGFVYVGLDGLATDRELNDWLTRALDYNPRAKASKKKSKKDQA